MKTKTMNTRLEQNINGIKSYQRLMVRRSCRAALSVLKNTIEFLDSAEKSLKKAQTKKTSGPAQKSFKELYEMAGKRNIKGRSKMNKRELQRILNQAR